MPPFDSPLQSWRKFVKKSGVCSEREGEAPAEPNISASREMGRSAERQLGRSE